MSPESKDALPTVTTLGSWWYRMEEGSWSGQECCGVGGMVRYGMVWYGTVRYGMVWKL